MVRIANFAPLPCPVTSKWTPAMLRNCLAPLVPCVVLMALAPGSLLCAAEPATSDMPKGEVKQYSFAGSKIFPGTVRDYWVYVPAQYDASKPACLYVNQDGIQWNAPAVFDELIARREMPVTIGVFVTPGARQSGVA